MLTRRRVLTTTASAGVVSLAGCATLVDYIGDMLLEDVNVFNGTERELTGSIEVVDPAGDTVLEETFAVEPDEDDDTDEDHDDDGPSEDDSSVVYADVFTEPGAYTVSVTLDEDSAIDDVTDVDQTVDVTDTDDEHIAVLLGSDVPSEPVMIVVIETFSDLAEHAEEDD